MTFEESASKVGGEKITCHDLAADLNALEDVLVGRLEGRRRPDGPPARLEATAVRHPREADSDRRRKSWERLRVGPVRGLLEPPPPSNRI